MNRTQNKTAPALGAPRKDSTLRLVKPVPSPEKAMEKNEAPSKLPAPASAPMVAKDSQPAGVALEPDLIEARRFLDQLDPNGQFTFQTVNDPKVGQKKRHDLANVFHGTLEDHDQALIDLNRQGAGVFVMVNKGDGKVHAGNKTCRTNKNVIRVRAAFVDLDGSPLDPVLEAKVLPSIIVQSSAGRWHAYWRLDDCPLDRFKQVQSALAKKFAGDPSVNDLSRVMRLPGFLHQKGEPFMTRIVNFDTFKGE